MGRPRMVVVAMSVAALAAVIAISALLARPGRASATATATARHPARLIGDGARTGAIAETTLHHAHVRGSEPVACRECHAITADDFARPDRERCLGCHPSRQAALHAAVGPGDVADVDKDPRQCTRCHDFLDDRPTAERAWQCDECHAQPHTDDMMLAGSTAEMCGRCHSPHGDQSTAPKACIGCHEHQGTEHQTTSDPGTGSCLACHRQHDAKANAVARCAACHAEREPRVPASALFRGGHEQCISCHTPHAFSKRTVASCTSCHANRVALAASRVGAHRDCRNCHDQHAVTGARAACRRCHAKVSPAHPADPGGADCLGCHPPHPPRAESARPAVACSTCHRQAHGDHAFHRGAACTDCHRQHGFALTLQPSLCLSCHAGRVGQAAPVAASTGHRDCTRCHGGEPHAPAAPPPCATCHAEQGATVPAGHARCTDCHDQHSGRLEGRAVTCTGCHADRKAGPHGRIKGGCQNCHRPHAPDGAAAPPPCLSCHRRAGLQGMHRVPQHAACTDCHAPHGPPPSAGREPCLRCHADKRTHEPAATSCTGCHPFATGAP